MENSTFQININIEQEIKQEKLKTLKLQNEILELKKEKLQNEKENWKHFINEEDSLQWKKVLLKNKSRII